MTSTFDLRGADGADGVDAETLRAQAVLDEAMADHAFDRALDQARDLGGRAGLRRLGQYAGRIAAVESQILAEHVQDDGNTKRAERLLDDAKTSKREQRQKAARAKATSWPHSLTATANPSGSADSTATQPPPKESR